MSDEELEFSISQYVDGTLKEAKRASIERLVNEDASAMALLEEYRRLNIVLKSETPLPNINWESFASRISAAIDAADARADDEIANRFRMPGWVKTVLIPMALAASVVIVTAIGYHANQLQSHSANRTVAVQASPASASFASVSVFGSRAASNEGTGEASVSIGPSADSKDAPLLVQYSGDVVSRSSHVAVASGVTPVHDTDAFLFDMQ